MHDILLCHYTKTEGQWIIRIDKPHGDKKYHQRHVHISRKYLAGEYSWNVDGTRHDKHRFPASEPQINKAKELAAAELRVPVSTLQFLTGIEGPCRVSASQTENEKPRRQLFSTYIRAKYCVIMLGTEDGLTFLVIPL